MCIPQNCLEALAPASLESVAKFPLLHYTRIADRGRRMKKWYLATCVVRLGEVQSINDGSGEKNDAVRGYAINIGVLGADLMQAMLEAERIAFCAFPGNRDGNELEEVKIKEAEFTMLREQLRFEEKGSNGEPVYRSKLIYFDE